MSRYYDEAMETIAELMNEEGFTMEDVLIALAEEFEGASSDLTEDECDEIVSETERAIADFFEGFE